MPLYLGNCILKICHNYIYLVAALPIDVKTLDASGSVLNDHDKRTKRFDNICDSN